MFDDYDYNGEPLEVNPCEGCPLIIMVVNANALLVLLNAAGIFIMSGSI